MLEFIQPGLAMRVWAEIAIQEVVAIMARDELGLENLTMFDFSPKTMAAHMAAIGAERQRYKDLYGDKWMDMMLADWDRDMDVKRRKSINCRIYSTGCVKSAPTDRVSDAEVQMFEARLHEVYGDQYGDLVQNRVVLDPRVAELLIQEALRNHEPEVLPDALRDEYDRRLKSDS